jgi:hypothetical protein
MIPYEVLKLKLLRLLSSNFYSAIKFGSSEPSG